MRRVVTAIAIVGVVLSMCVMSQVLLAGDSATKADAAATKAKAAKTRTATPADRVVVMYFHRTVRCPTCRRMGSYSEEAVVEGFASRSSKAPVSSTTLTSKTRGMRH